MSELTAEQIAQRALDLDLLDERDLESVWSECGTRDIDPNEFRNLAREPGFETEVDELAGQLAGGWRAARPDEQHLGGES